MRQARRSWPESPGSPAARPGSAAGALDRAFQRDFADAGEADALDLRGGALEHRGFGIDHDPHPDEFGPVGQQADLVDLADGNALEIDGRALVEPPTPWLK